MSAPATSPPGVTGYRPGPITRATAILHRAGPWLLRGSLALVLIWFGALKVAGVSTMPAALIAAITPPFVDPGLLARLTGVLEVALGAGLLIGRWKPSSWRASPRSWPAPSSCRSCDPTSPS